MLAQLGRDYEGALLLSDRAIVLNPNSCHAHHVGGWVRNFLSMPKEALFYFETALRLSPLDPMAWLVKAGMAQANIVLHRHTQGLDWARQAVQENANFAPAHTALVAALALTDRLDQAALAKARLLELLPRFRISLSRKRAPHRNPSILDPLYEGLRKAGLPE